MREVRIIDCEIVVVPDDPACWRPFARIDVLTRREKIRRYGEGRHVPACERATVYDAPEAPSGAAETTIHIVPLRHPSVVAR